jgi:hypothetical protein
MNRGKRGVGFRESSSTSRPCQCKCTFNKGKCTIKGNCTDPYKYYQIPRMTQEQRRLYGYEV